MRHRTNRTAGLVALGLAGALAVTLPTPARAADFSDPTWPCIQRKVERLSLGIMWPAEITEVELTAQTAAAADDLVSQLVLRRVDLEQAQAYVDDFAAEHGRDPALMGHVFQQVFTRLDNRRFQVISGIGDFSLDQIALSERIEKTHAEMDSLMAADDPDFDRVDSLEEQVVWDERIYKDRQQSLVYVCETPVLLEQRLYALGKMLMDAAES